MIIHIGYDACVDSTDTLAVLNPICASAPDTAALIRKATDEGHFTPCSIEPRAYVLTDDGVTASALHTATLKKRFDAHGLVE